MATSKEAAPRRSRNAHLSAYYGLRKEDEIPVLQAAQLEDTTNHRESIGASDLIKRLPLEQLVKTSTQIRNDANALEQSLHGSVQQCYAQLDAAADEGIAIRELAKALSNDGDGTLKSIEHACGMCSRINNSMSETREKIEDLEESRRVMLLLRASSLLEKELPGHLQELAELCTDPENARNRLLLTVRRCSFILPQLICLSKTSPTFARSTETLSMVIETVVNDIERRLDANGGSIDGLSLYDIMSIRMQLSTQGSGLRDFFQRTSNRLLSSCKPPTSSVRAASRSPLSMAAYYIHYGAKVVLQEVKKVCRVYGEIFNAETSQYVWPQEPPKPTALEFPAEEFTFWIMNVVDEVITANVRKPLTDLSLSSKKPSPSTDQSSKLPSQPLVLKNDVQEFRKSIMVLRKEAECFPDDVGSSVERVSVIVNTICDSVVSEAFNAVQEIGLSQIIDIITSFKENFEKSRTEMGSEAWESVLKKAARDIQDVVEEYESLLIGFSASDVKNLSESATGEVSGETVTNHPLNARSLLVMAVDRLLPQADSTFSGKDDILSRCRSILMCAVLCKELASFPSNLRYSTSLLDLSNEMAIDFTEVILDHVSNTFRSFTRQALPSGENPYSCAHEIVTLIQNARALLDLFPLNSSGLREMWLHSLSSQPGSNPSLGIQGADEIDPGGIEHQILEKWLQVIRLGSFREEDSSVIEFLSKIQDELFIGTDEIQKATLERSI